VPLLPLVACQGDGRSAHDHIARIETALSIPGGPATAASLAERMEHHNVPGVSIAVFNDGAIEWARGYGLADVAEEHPVTARTLFQAASISKPVAASAMLTFVQDGALQLDQDVYERLRSWKVPGNRFTAAEPVTLRRLVTHSAGMTVSGFPGYARGEEVPGTVEVLDGLGNTDPIRVDTIPGALWRYSGGGYTVMQLLLSDVAGKPFPEVMQERVLDPVGMSESTYQQPLPESRWGQAATGYRRNGTEVEEKWHTYPEMAAAGLWTTPSDLARWAMAIQRAAAGSGEILAPEWARAMLEPDTNDWGLGPPIHPSGAFFHHSGGNEGFRCHLVAFMEGDRGAVIMTNSDAGAELIREILVTLEDEYDWPALQLD
jgi:CubicO group peptidase (beta-lactamase class C family)